MSTIRYVTAPELSKQLQAGSKVGTDIAVVDVRDQDFEGGNIPGALNVPSETHTNEVIKELVDRLSTVPRVVFHCALSQVRGPTAARAYAAELERRASAKDIAAEQAAPKGAAGFALPNPYASKPQQEVLVLRDGFTGWQSLYRNDPALVEKWDAGVWGGYSQ